MRQYIAVSSLSTGTLRTFMFRKDAPFPAQLKIHGSAPHQIHQIHQIMEVPHIRYSLG